MKVTKNKFYLSQYRKGHFGRKRHSANSSKTQNDFWNRVNKDGPVPAHVPKLGNCWLWTGMKNIRGYGQFWNGETTVKASKYSYQLNIGQIPDGLFVCHHCDNPSCVRPDHLFVGTHTDNMRDAAKKKRLFGSKQTHCKWGHEFTPENTKIYKGVRACRICCNIRSKRYRELSHP